AKFLGGINWKKEGNSDYAFLFWGLPKIPILLLLWKAVEDFSAEAKILFDTSAIRYLDAESLAVLAMILADKLTEKKMN
ncbi:MAG: Fe-S cluster protein, partial [Thermoplasmata archaeon]